MCGAGAWGCHHAGTQAEETVATPGGRGAADVGPGRRSSADNEKHAVIPWQPSGVTAGMHALHMRVLPQRECLARKELLAAGE
jgi:hypothetical protein